MKNKIITILQYPIIFGLVALVICSALTAIAQDTPKTAKFEYCEIAVMQKMLSLKMTATVDKGEPIRENTTIIDPQTGKAKEFNSAMHVLNYMAESGWELVNVYVLIGPGSATRWVLRRTK